MKNFALALFSTSTLLAFTADPRHALVAGSGYVPRSWVHFQDARASTISVDDALVLGAIIEHTILPEVRRSNSGRNRAVVVLIQDRSLALCRNSQEPQTRCRIPEHWRQFLVPNPARGWPGMIADDRRRQELVESLEARNAVAHALPATGHPAVALIPADPSKEARQRYYEQAGGVASLSVPGYSSDGHALVYGSYGCGSLCGYSWLFALEKTDGVWRVQLAIVTAIS